MRPILFHICLLGEDYAVESYLVFNIILSNLFFLLLSTFFLVRNALRKGIAIISALSVVMVALIGSKLTHLIGSMNWDFSSFHLNAFFTSGFSLFGGILFSLPLILLLSLLLKIPPWKFLDLLTPGMAIAIFFNKLGCFLNGCCFGIPTLRPWGVVFPKGTRAYHYYASTFLDKTGEYLFYSPGSILLHPVQLYESFAGLIFFLLALFLHKKKTQNGVIFLSVFYLFSFSRIIFYFFRAPNLKATTLNQHLFLLYVISALSSLFLLYWRQKMGRGNL